MRIASFGFALALAAVVAGCASDAGWKRRAFAFSSGDETPAAVPGTNTIALAHVSISPLFQTRSFTYRTGEDAYEQDPYAGFLVSPETALAAPLRRSLAVFGRVLEPGSALPSTLTAEATVTELYGDLRKPGQLTAVLRLHLVVYRPNEQGPQRVVFDRVCSASAPLARNAPDALMAAWETDLHTVLDEVASSYAKSGAVNGAK